MKKTALYDAHIHRGGHMVEFAGHELPVRYENYGVIAEHNAVRKAAGLFDVSHMGEIIISGKNAETALNYLLTNDIRGMYDGQVRYSPLPNERGGAVDDVLVYRYNSEKFLLVVNASNLAKDAEWIASRLPSDVTFDNISENIAQIALQGPLYKDIMVRLTVEEELPAKYYSFKDNVAVRDVKCLISRTGYTGENGYELYCAGADAMKLYGYLMEVGAELGLIPAGLGARDTLRLEAGMPLYGHELGEDIPLSEVDLGFAIKMGKEDFIGKTALLSHVPAYCRIGAKVLKGIAREGDKVFCGEVEVGTVTSGTHSPTLGFPIAVLRVLNEYKDKPLAASVRGRMLELEIVPLPFYKKA
ncbi:MAG: glycine cleavage system aminomethyltransferase GcvT [Firmicutes bacterium]|nr:glycine cleavage system aminomethyltransferase GcvT [Bacillota bacterium]